MSTRITHVLNPFNARPGSATALAQTAAFASFERAITYTRHLAPDIELEFVCACYPEDEPAIPAFCTHRATLERSLLDVTDAEPRRKLPLIADIVRAGVELGTGDTLVYTNSDIGLQPFFYELVARLLRDHPGFGICRRNIDERTTDPADLAIMQAQGGQRHYGIDTFVCPRAHAAGFDLGDIAIALPTIEYALLANIDAACGFKACVYKHLHATFHHGGDGPWSGQDELCAFNLAQTKAVAERLVQAHPRFRAGSLFDWMQAKLRDERRPKVKRPWHKLMDAMTPGPKHPEPFRVPPNA